MNYTDASTLFGRQLPPGLEGLGLGLLPNPASVPLSPTLPQAPQLQGPLFTQPGSGQPAPFNFLYGNGPGGAATGGDFQKWHEVTTPGYVDKTDPNNPVPHPPVTTNEPDPGATPGAAFQPQAPTPGLGPTGKPYFDPAFPVESMEALKNYLAPQVQGGVDQSMQARGLYSSGLRPAMETEAMSRLSQLAPNVSPGEAQAMDLQRLYGPEVVNRLISTGQLQGATPFQGYGLGDDVALVPRDFQASVPGSTDIQQHYRWDPSLPAPGKGQPTAGWGLWDYSTATPMAGPGYFYNPTQQPGNLPWLKGA